MSTNEDAEADDSGTTETGGDSGTDAGPGTREVAYRLFATEFEDSELSYSESDEERAPNYVVTPTGLRLNRLFAVGVLTEVERLNSDTLRGRIVDPTGAFVTYAGQYQPEAQAFLDGADSPSFVAITGKARTFEPDDADRIFTSVRPESLSEVTADTRDRWTVSVAEATLERLAVVAAALDADLQGDELRAALETAGVDAPLAAGIPRALDYYGTTTAYLEAIRRVAVDALEVVTGERDEVRPVDVAPDEGGSATLGPLPDVGIDLAGDATESAEPAETPVSATSESADSTATADTEAATATADTAESSEPTTGSTESATEPSEPATTSAESTTEPTTTEAATETTAESTTTATSDDSSPPDTATTATSDDPSPADTATESTTAESSSTATDREPTASSEPATTDDGVTDTDDVGDTVDDTADEPEMYQLDDEEREELESEFGADFSSGNEVDPAGEADIDVPDAEELAAEAAEGEPSDGDTVTAESTPADTAESPTTDATPTETSDPAESTDSTETLGSFEDTIDDTAGSATDTESDRSAASDDADGDDSDTTTTDGDAAAAGSEATDIDLEDAAVELMAELDDGDGADREAVVEEVAAAHGVEPAAVEDAIDDALMGGRCYEPDEGTLKPI